MMESTHPIRVITTLRERLYIQGIWFTRTSTNAFIALIVEFVMEHYSLFLMTAAVAVLSPGPGVTFTLTNSIRYGLYEAFGGILGLAIGGMIVAAISATGLGLVLAASPLVFTIMKYMGAAYLVYLAAKMWRSTPVIRDDPTAKSPGMGKRFIEGLSLQFSNPKAIFFFVSIFPQFIDHSAGYAIQFFTLVLTYALLVVAIHFIYASIANRARQLLSSQRAGRIVNRIGACAFLFFAIVMATSNL